MIVKLRYLRYLDLEFAKIYSILAITFEIKLKENPYVNIYFSVPILEHII